MSIDYINQFEGEDEDEEEDADKVAVDEARRKKLPFSFLMHHYLKTNGGSGEEGFYKPKHIDVKLNNFMSSKQQPTAQPRKPGVNVSNKV